jgi:hypothetical protein
MKSSIAELKPKDTVTLILYLFILESLILFIILVLVKALSHVHQYFGIPYQNALARD